MSDPDAADDAALRDGAPVDGGAGSDPRLIAAERVIRQLRTLLGAVALEHDGRLILRAEQVSDPRARSVRVRVELGGDVTVEVPEVAQEPRPQAPRSTTPHPIGNDALLQRLAALAERHSQRAPDSGAPEDGDSRDPLE